MSKSISYTNLEQILRQIGAHIDAAETHGLLTGMLSLGNANPVETKWRAILLENLDCEDPDKTQWGVLTDISTQVTNELSDINFTFKILLPNDDNELAERIDALGFWCRGYLSGLGLVGITQDHLSNDVVKELVQDLSQIAHVSIDTDSSEEDENNYMELVEYVRVAVQNIQTELTGKERMLH